MRMYFAAVAPPKPPPITTTRAFDGTVLAHPAQPGQRAGACGGAGELEEVASANVSWSAS